MAPPSFRPYTWWYSGSIHCYAGRKRHLGVPARVNAHTSLRSSRSCGELECCVIWLTSPWGGLSSNATTATATHWNAFRKSFYWSRRTAAAASILTRPWPAAASGNIAAATQVVSQVDDVGCRPKVPLQRVLLNIAGDSRSRTCRRHPQTCKYLGWDRQ